MHHSIDGVSSTELKRRSEEERYNGECSGSVICVDNLGRCYDADEIKSQFQRLLQGVKNIWFSEVEHRGVKYRWGWCKIEFVSREAAVKGLFVMDHVYLRVGKESVARPLLAHFPDWESPLTDLELAAKYESTALCLHLGQPSNMDQLSWAFVKLEKALSKTKQSCIQDIVQKLKECLTQSTQTVTETSNKNYSRDDQTIWLKHVPLDISQVELLSFFGCYDREVTIRRLCDSVSEMPTTNVFVSFSCPKKTKHVLEDIHAFMLLCRGVRPMAGSILDISQEQGFESVFDLALSSVGWKIDKCGSSNQLIVIDGEENEEYKNAVEMRSILDEMQHTRSQFRKFKHKRRLQLAQQLSKQLKNTYEKYKKVNDLIERSDQL